MRDVNEEEHNPGISLGSRDTDEWQNEDIQEYSDIADADEESSDIADTDEDSDVCASQTPRTSDNIILDAGTYVNT